MRVWCFGAKVSDVDREIQFLQSLGGRVILDERLHFGETEFRIPLVQFGDKYLHLGEAMVYEDELDTRLSPGLAHVVLTVDDLEPLRSQALHGGATEILPVTRVSAGFGTRDVAFLQSPGGILMELARIRQHRVPNV
jgi:hypothetical protein